MIISVICYFFIGFFAAFGFLCFLAYLRNYIDELRILKGKMIFTVIAAKNDEENIEGVVNAILFKSEYFGTGSADNKLLVVDIGSTDKTAEIINKMSERRKNVLFVTPEELNQEIHSAVFERAAR